MISREVDESEVASLEKEVVKVKRSQEEQNLGSFHKNWIKWETQSQTEGEVLWKELKD